MPWIADLRSDTVTQPTPAMRAAMAQAVVGDDVIGDDPTVQNLQEFVADLLGKEASLFMPSGTMTNQIAIRLHCQPGDEFLCEAECHVYNYEQAAFAQLSGVVARTLNGVNGVLRADQFHGKVRAEDDHLVRTRLICLENTHNRGGGKVQPLDEVNSICDWAHRHSLLTHLDGARLFNAAAALDVDVKQLTAGFDSVSVCFSKGLGAPVGSALAGSREFIARAKRARKLFGGAMRQVGIIAAGALFAVQQHRSRLVEDHRNATRLADSIRSMPALTLEPEPETNIVIVRLAPELGDSEHFCRLLAAKGIGALTFGPEHVRFVTHLDVTTQQIDRAAEILAEVVQAQRNAAKLAS